MNQHDLAPGALLNEDRPCLNESEEYLTLYNDTPAPYLGAKMPLRAAIDTLRPDLVRTDALVAIYADRTTWFGTLERNIIDEYILPMTVKQTRCSLQDVEFAIHALPIVHGFRRNRIFVEISATSLVTEKYEKFAMRRRWTYVRWENYGKIDECFYRNGDICIVAEPFCILPCGLIYCYNGRTDTVFLLDYDTGRAVEVDYGDKFPFNSDYWPKSHMFDDAGQEHNVNRKFVGQH